MRPSSGCRGGAWRRASISSSCPSVSFCPSRSNSLTPLYSGGLCDAEMTAPRSSASSATAGVGRIPPRTAVPPAEAAPPRGGAPRGDRLLERGAGAPGVPPDEARAAAGPDRRRAAEPLDELRSQVLAHDTAHTVGAEVTPRQGGLALGELRRLAGLVETGLLALDDPRVAREEAFPLERD